jgi:hypothetical protein
METTNPDKQKLLETYWTVGEPITAAKLNDMSRAIQTGLQGANDARQIAYGNVAGASIQQCKLAGFGSYYLRCHTWDGTNEGTDNFYVALPSKLRPSTWDGQTISGISYVSTGLQTLTATRTSDSSVENWQIVLPYSIGDILYVMANIRGGSGVVDGLGNAIKYVDMNTDARAWAKV